MGRRRQTVHEQGLARVRQDPGLERDASCGGLVAKVVSIQVVYYSVLGLLSVCLCSLLSVGAAFGCACPEQGLAWA